MQEPTEKKETHKCTIKKAGKYLREVSVVVIGVAITFIVSDWISGRNESRDLERYLNAIKLELNENLTIIEDEAERYRFGSDFSLYLSSTDPQHLHIDSLMKYGSVIGDLYKATHSKSAFEMLKSSGAMRLIKNEVLLMSIINCYTLIDEAENARNTYIERKTDELFDAVLKEGVVLDELLSNPADPKAVKLLNFYALNTNIHDSFEDCIYQIKQTLALFK